MWGDNQAWIAEHGVSVYLKRTPEQILSRLSPHGRYKRPKLRGLSDEEVLQVMREGIAEREPIYLKADVVIDCDKVNDYEIADKLVEFITENGKRTAAIKSRAEAACRLCRDGAVKSPRSGIKTEN